MTSPSAQAGMDRLRTTRSRTAPKTLMSQDHAYPRPSLKRRPYMPTDDNTRVLLDTRQNDDAVRRFPIPALG